MSTKELPLRIRENFFEVRNGRTIKLKLSEVQLDVFGISIKEEYKHISKAAIEILLQFCTTYICEQSFSSLLLIKNDKRSCIKKCRRRTSSCSFKYLAKNRAIVLIKTSANISLIYEHKSYSFFAFLVFLRYIFVTVCHRI